MEASHFQITAVYAGILALMLVMLGILVVKNRYRAKVGLFDGGDEQLGQAIRVHGNFAEYVPMALLVMAFAEAGGSPHWLIHCLGAILVVGRLLHAHGLYHDRGVSKCRRYGVIATIFVLVVGGLANIGLGIFGSL
ncbi:MAG: hypothetical protein HOB79_04770 [Rhodospirillaceae bacterium]|jgi:hypothetical protein|nr:hypothetical protein [Rhodospirillaceae bacterium]MBT7486110.1 hypothetical protein [Rhodospirillales bacterium]MBT4700367.1 hypothetical protein [Rhodospirillaceae bacterium]MBT5033309.1 hypothetical protein [Rhodospirillaceae bacterium]MBT6220931.1 hypothetical protein [Rhodospirillaceae bacterium]